MKQERIQSEKPSGGWRETGSQVLEMVRTISVEIENTEVVSFQFIDPIKHQKYLNK